MMLAPEWLIHAISIVIAASFLTTALLYQKWKRSEEERLFWQVQVKAALARIEERQSHNRDVQKAVEELQVSTRVAQLSARVAKLEQDPRRGGRAPRPEMLKMGGPYR